MENMKIYEGHREVPKTALKPITAGRLKGMSDINPMFRIKSLTEDFGACGIGWYYAVDKQWIETFANEAVAFVNISLYIKVDGEWSKPIFGTGGSKIVAMERNGAYVSDEAFKMATTDALSVACKQLGYGADIYWQNDKTKYSPYEDKSQNDKQNESQEAEKKAEQIKEMLTPEAIEKVDKNLIPKSNALISEEQINLIFTEMERTGVSEKQILQLAKADKINEMSQATAVAIINKLHNTGSKG